MGNRNCTSDDPAVSYLPCLLFKISAKIRLLLKMTNIISFSSFPLSVTKCMRYLLYTYVFYFFCRHCQREDAETATLFCRVRGNEKTGRSRGS